MTGVSPFLVVSLPLIAVLVLVNRPVAAYQRPRMAALVLFVGLTGLAAGRVHGDSNFLVASLGVAPVRSRAPAASARRLTR